MPRNDDNSISMRTKETAASDSFSTRSNDEADSEYDTSEGEYSSSEEETDTSEDYTESGHSDFDMMLGASRVKAAVAEPTLTRSDSTTRLRLSQEKCVLPETPPKREAPVRIASSDDIDVRPHSLTEKEETLIDWVVQLLKEHLQRIVAHRVIMQAEDDHAGAGGGNPPDLSEFIAAALARSMQNKGMGRGRPRFGIIDQMVDVIEFPKPTEHQHMLMDPEAYQRVELADEVKAQLEVFVREIAAMYHSENPFHNFEHACNVTLAASKFLMRMVTEQGPNQQRATDKTYGIATDPLTLFACVFAALIHDTDHEGVPSKFLSNAVLYCCNCFCFDFVF